MFPDTCIPTWLNYLVTTLIIVQVTLLILLILGKIIECIDSGRFQRNSIGMSYRDLVLQLGSPTDREKFPDGTEVLCWREYHKAHTTLTPVCTGSTVIQIPRSTKAYVDGWKAVIQNGICINMEKV